MSTDPEGRLLLVAALGAGMAHEMRNVLAAAESSLYLADKLDEPALRVKHIQAARAHVRTAQALVDRALAPALHAGLAAETVVVREVCDLASRTARLGDHASLTVEADDALAVNGDVLLLERALVNLVENAVGAAGARPLAIVMTARADGDDAVRIEVRDDGPGIPAEVKARLFEPLATARPGGIGLGLPLVRAIAEAHRGRVEVESDEHGTRVALTLPRAGTPASATP